ncbi:MAG: DUF1573 domain-containing protein [Planctomycetota bacterium]
MRPLNLVVLSTALLAAALFAGLAGCGSEADGLVVEPASIDFGSVRHGEVRHATIRLTNRGSTDVSFQATPSCACFALGAGYRTLLGPGEHVDLQLRFDSARTDAGVMEKSLEIRTTEGGGSKVSVKLTADIVRVVDVVGTQIRLEQLPVEGSSEPARSAEFRPTQGYTLAVERIVPLEADAAFLTFTAKEPGPDGAILVEVARKADAQRRIGPFKAGAQVHFLLTAPDGRIAKFQETIQVLGTWIHAPSR